MVRPRSSRRRAQTSIYETDLTETQPELLAALRSRESMKEALSTAKQNFETANGRVDPLIAKLELGEDAAVRVGDFVITSKKSKETPVEFVRQASTRIRIKKIAD
jgi:hypothetical protein